MWSDVLITLHHPGGLIDLLGFEPKTEQQPGLDNKSNNMGPKGMLPSRGRRQKIC
jgi:hypothetical protein